MSLDERLKYAEMKARHKGKTIPWYKKLWGKILIIFLFFLAMMIILSTIYVFKEVKRIQREGFSTQNEEMRQAYLDAVSGPSGYSLGSNNPKISIIQFSDFSCPYCRQAALEIIPLVNEYQDSVKLTIRDFPVHENSIDLALAVRCAGEQGKYWDAYALTFSQQDILLDTGAQLKADLLAWAEILGLNIGQFETCFDERRYITSIKRDYDDGILLEIEGAPTWFINNYPLTGYYSADKFREMFDNILKTMEIEEGE